MNARSKQVWTVVMGMLAVLLLPVLLAGLAAVRFAIFVLVAIPLCHAFKPTSGMEICAQCLPVCPVVVAASLLFIPAVAWIAYRLLKNRSRLP